MHARIDGGDIKLLTRTGLDWSHRYRTIEALGFLKVKSAYSDGELCALYPTECRHSAACKPRWMKAGRVNPCNFVFDLCS